MLTREFALWILEIVGKNCDLAKPPKDVNTYDFDFSIKALNHKIVIGLLYHPQLQEDTMPSSHKTGLDNLKRLAGYEITDVKLPLTKKFVEELCTAGKKIPWTRHTLTREFALWILEVVGKNCDPIKNPEDVNTKDFNIPIDSLNQKSIPGLLRHPQLQEGAMSPSQKTGLDNLKRLAECVSAAAEQWSEEYRASVDHILAPDATIESVSDSEIQDLLGELANGNGIACERLEVLFRPVLSIIRRSARKRIYNVPFLSDKHRLAEDIEQHLEKEYVKLIRHLKPGYALEQMKKYLKISLRGSCSHYLQAHRRHALTEKTILYSSRKRTEESGDSIYMDGIAAMNQPVTAAPEVRDILSGLIDLMKSRNISEKYISLFFDYYLSGLSGAKLGFMYNLSRGGPYWVSKIKIPRKIAKNPIYQSFLETIRVERLKIYFMDMYEIVLEKDPSIRNFRQTLRKLPSAEISQGISIIDPRLEQPADGDVPEEWIERRDAVLAGRADDKERAILERTVVKKASPEDMDEILEIYRNDYLPGIRRPYSESNRERFVAFTSALIEERGPNKGVVLLAKLDGRIVGFSMAYIELESRNAVMEAVAVRGQCRKHGLGRLLLENTLNWLKKAAPDLESVRGEDESVEKQTTKILERYGFHREDDGYIWLHLDRAARGTVQETSPWLKNKGSLIDQIERRLKAGESVDEEDVTQVFNRLAKEALSPEGFETLKKVNEFYARMRNIKGVSDDILSGQNKMAKDYFSHLPFVKAIFGAGQLHAGMYNPVSRRFLALVELSRGNIDEETFLRRDLPDYDFIHVFESPTALPPALKRCSDEEQRVFFRDMLEASAEWPSIRENIFIDFPVSTIKLTGSLDERKNMIPAFAEEGKIAVCFANPIPLELWNMLPLFICEDDFEYLNCIRDLLIGLDSPLMVKEGVKTRVPQEFQINFLLNRIKNGGPQSLDSVMETVSAEIAKSMPDRPMHFAAKGLKEFSRRYWAKTFELAGERGLIVAIEGDKMDITDSGRSQIGNILEERARRLDVSDQSIKVRNDMPPATPRIVTPWTSANCEQSDLMTGGSNATGIYHERPVGQESILTDPETEANKIHDENLKLEHMPYISPKTILCHIIMDSILPSAKQRGMLNRLAIETRKVKYPEKIIQLSVKNPDSKEEFMAKLKEVKNQSWIKDYEAQGYAVQFDIACPSRDLVAMLQDQMPALAFENAGNDEHAIIQLEGIMLALRVLRTGGMEDLRSVYKLLTGQEPETAKTMKELAKKLLFTLPITKLNVDEINRIITLQKENIEQAA